MQPGSNPRRIGTVTKRRKLKSFYRTMRVQVGIKRVLSGIHSMSTDCRKWQSLPDWDVENEGI